MPVITSEALSPFLPLKKKKVYFEIISDLGKKLQKDFMYTYCHRSSQNVNTLHKPSTIIKNKKLTLILCS